MQQLSFGGHMVAVMALMEAPAIIVGVMLLKLYSKGNGTSLKNTISIEGQTIENNGDSGETGLKEIIKHSLINGSVLMIVGSLIIGIVADSKQAEGIKPFTTDIFKGFLAIFLLDMGMLAASRLKAFKKQGPFLFLFAILMPLFNGCWVSFASQWLTSDEGNRLVFAVLAASASYIAVPAAMRLVAPKADPGIYIPMALGLTFPFNITIGMPLFFQIIHG
jgi:hypothetical protein